MKGITTFLMFVGKQHGKAEEALNFYCTLFDNSGILFMEKYGKNESEPEGTVKIAVFKLNEQLFMAMDSASPHPFAFTPAISLYVELETVAEIDRIFEKLSEDGAVLMGLDAYPFSKKYGWVQDQFGISWQLNLP